MKGIALVGALSVLMEAGYTFPRVAGTSAGAIVGALLAADTSAGDMRSIMAATDYAVRASMSIPFFFEPVRFEYERTVDGRRRMMGVRATDFDLGAATRTA